MNHQEFQQQFTPNEHRLQCGVIEWRDRNSTKHPCLALLYAIPNGARRTRKSGARLKREGMLPGMPDLCLPVARMGYHALYIEMKRGDIGRVTTVQKEIHERLKLEGNCVKVARSTEEAISIIKFYLTSNK